MDRSLETMLFSCKRPRDLLFQCGGALAAFLIGSALYSELGHRFTEWFVHDKLPEIQKQVKFEFDSRTNPISNFPQVDFSNVNWGGQFESTHRPH